MEELIHLHICKIIHYTSQQIYLTLFRLKYCIHYVRTLETMTGKHAEYNVHKSNSSTYDMSTAKIKLTLI